MIHATQQDLQETALCIWKEARGMGEDGMTAVACVIRNRVLRNNSSFAAEVLRKSQFSSMTAPNDPQLHLLPGGKDPSWTRARMIAAVVINESLGDTTNGSNLYYDNSIGFPKAWDRSRCVPTVKIGRLNFFREV